jgi:hypothetical protein
LDHFLFEIVEGGFRVKEAGFEGDAEISAIVIEDTVEKAAALIQFRIFSAAVGFYII